MKSDDEGDHDRQWRGSKAGFVGRGNMGVLKSVAGTRYQAVASDNASSSDEGKAGHVQSFEVDLLNDVEGASEKIRLSRDEEGVTTYPESDEWMRNIWAVQNRAVVMSYFCVGFAMRFLNTPTFYYTLHVLGASPAQLNILYTLAGLPWSFKLVYGFISDNFPIMGMRRKPYFIMGWVVYVLMNLYTATKETPSIQLLAVVTLISAMGFMLSDVTTDAILVERSKHEPRETMGSMQAIGYTVRFLGSLLGSLMGLLLYNKEEWGWGLSIQQLFFLNAIFPVVFLAPWVASLRETAVVTDHNTPVKQRLQEQCKDVFRALEQKAVHVPLIVIFVYNLFQVGNAAWKPFLVEGLAFTNYEIGILGVIASLMASCGLYAYKTWFFHANWRKLYIWTTLIVAFFSAFQLVLVFRMNKIFGIGDLAFSIGDDSIYDFVSSIQFLPVVQMYISMCPDGAEGTTYAILTTITNTSLAAASNIATMFTGIWDVSNETLSRGDFSGVWKLTLLTSLLQPLPLILIRYLPGSQAEQRALQTSGLRNPLGGQVLLTVLFGSLLWTVALSLKELST